MFNASKFFVVVLNKKENLTIAEFYKVHTVMKIQKKRKFYNAYNN